MMTIDICRIHDGQIQLLTSRYAQQRVCRLFGAGHSLTEPFDEIKDINGVVQIQLHSTPLT